MSSSRLSEIPWALTLSLFEVLRFGHCGWWWKLRWAFWREYRDLDIAGLLENRSVECDYDETPTATLGKILEVASLPEGGRFVDLGAGRGLTVIAAGLMGYRAAGLELLDEYVKRSGKVTSRLGLSVDLRQGDFMVSEWPEGDLYFVSATAFPEDLRKRLQERLRELARGIEVVTFDWSLNPEHFEEFDALRLPVTRGTVLCRFFRCIGTNDKIERDVEEK